MTGDPLCVLEAVEKGYGKGSRVLGPLSLGVFPGEVLGLRGPNGAGKTTLLKLLAGVFRPDRGRCLRDPALKGQVGYVPQEIALYESLSGLDNLRYWGAVYGLPEKAVRARSRWLLEQMELTEKGRDPVSSYSGGMARRLHLATALMATPRLLLLDEPTVGADDHSAQLILSLLDRQKSLGCAIVWTTHRAGELERLSSRILVLNQDGTPAGEVLP